MAGRWGAAKAVALVRSTVIAIARPARSRLPMRASCGWRGFLTRTRACGMPQGGGAPAQRGGPSSDPGAGSTAEQAGWEEQDRPEQLEDAFDGDAEQPERQGNQPDD